MSTETAEHNQTTWDDAINVWREEELKAIPLSEDQVKAVVDYFEEMRKQ